MDLTQPIDEEFADDMNGDRNPPRDVGLPGFILGCAAIAGLLLFLLGVGIMFGWSLNEMLGG